ncbi:MAG: elongation factor G, partial [Clostridia bacterium]|nr:elongation factor G [Clostridia bacterium]
MANLTTKSIRNVALLGHGGSGKTTLAEAMLYGSGTTDRFGRTPDGTTVCDYDTEEIRRGFSLSLATANLEWNDIKINLLDTPGYLDFSGEVLQGVRVADAGVIVVDGKAGLEVGAELAWDYVSEAGIPRAFFVNKCDDPDANFNAVFNDLHDKFGTALCPVFVPIRTDKNIIMIDLISMKAYRYNEKGKREELMMRDEWVDLAASYKDILNEALAGTSEELMEKYFEGEEITRDEAVLALHEGIIAGSIVPVYCGAATKMWGVYALMDAIAESFPRPTARGNEISADGDKVAIEVEGTDTSILVYKTSVDQYGLMSFFKVMNGSLTRDMVLKNLTSGASEKMAHIYTMRGKKSTEVDELVCGDLGMIQMLVNTKTGDTLRLSGDVKYKAIDFPKPYMTRAIVPAAKGDEDKISGGLAKLLEEDRTLIYENNAETKQMTISGTGDIHLDVTVARLKARYGTSVVLTEPRIAYRETIKGTSDVEGKHKKQSGGSGQYGHVKIRFSHGEEDGLTFTQSVVGGTVPKNFYPAVEKGLQEAMAHGVLAGYPVVNLTA